MSTDRQRPLQATPTADRVELDIAFEDAGGLSALGPQKQASVRFDSSMPLAALGIFGAQWGAQWRNTAQFALTMLLASLSGSNAKADNPSQLLAATVETLVEVNEDQFLASLTDVDRQELIAARDKLIDVVGTDENHLLTPLMNFIDNLVRDREEKSDMPIHRPRRSKRVGRPANRPRVKLADLLGPETKGTGHSETVDTTSLEMRRPERVGCPADRPRLKLADLLAREAEHIAAREADNGTPMDNEV